MANLNDPRERQKFLQEQVNLNRQRLKANSSPSLLVMQTDIISRLMEMLEDKDELEYLRLKGLLWQLRFTKAKQTYMRPWLIWHRAA